MNPESNIRLDKRDIQNWRENSMRRPSQILTNVKCLGWLTLLRLLRNQGRYRLLLVEAYLRKVKVFSYEMESIREVKDLTEAPTVSCLWNYS